MTFQYDHIIRLKNGQPVGRIVLRSDDDYKPAQDFCAVIVKIPKCFGLKYNGLEVYVEGNPYKLPDIIEPTRIKTRETDDVISHVKLTYNGEQDDEKRT